MSKMRSLEHLLTQADGVLDARLDVDLDPTDGAEVSELARAVDRLDARSERSRSASSTPLARGTCTSRMDVHHLGRTNPGNGGPACGRHNRLKDHGFAARRDARSRMHVYRPDGTEIE